MTKTNRTGSDHDSLIARAHELRIDLPKGYADAEIADPIAAEEASRQIGDN
jgi:hypothetical protein